MATRIADEVQQSRAFFQNAAAAPVIMPLFRCMHSLPTAIPTRLADNGHIGIKNSKPDSATLESQRWLTRWTQSTYTYMEEHIRELIGTPPNRPQEAGDQVDDYQVITAKLNPSWHADSARAKLEQISQREEELVAQYYVTVHVQITKCEFPDIEDTIRSKLLQTMKDGKLRRETMIKRYTLTQFLEHAANKDDIDRQAHTIENADTNREVKRVYSKNRYPLAPKADSCKGKSTPENPRKPTQAPECSFCGFNHSCLRSKCPASGQICAACGRRGHFPNKMYI